MVDCASLVVVPFSDDSNTSVRARACAREVSRYGTIGMIDTTPTASSSIPHQHFHATAPYQPCSR
jgi:hypothetical protein